MQDDGDEDVSDITGNIFSVFWVSKIIPIFVKFKLEKIIHLHCDRFLIVPFLNV